MLFMLFAISWDESKLCMIKGKEPFKWRLWAKQLSKNISLNGKQFDRVNIRNARVFFSFCLQLSWFWVSPWIKPKRTTLTTTTHTLSLTHTFMVLDSWPCMKLSKYQKVDTCKDFSYLLSRETHQKSSQSSALVVFLKVQCVRFMRNYLTCNIHNYVFISV